MGGAEEGLEELVQNQGLIEMSDYIAWLTISPSSTGARRIFSSTVQYTHLPEQIAHALREILTPQKMWAVILRTPKKKLRNRGSFTIIHPSIGGSNR